MIFFYLENHPYITSAHGLGEWVQKVPIFDDIHYCIYAAIVNGSKKIMDGPQINKLVSAAARSAVQVTGSWHKQVAGVVVVCTPIIGSTQLT